MSNIPRGLSKCLHRLRGEVNISLFNSGMGEQGQALAEEDTKSAALSKIRSSLEKVFQE